MSDSPSPRTRLIVGDCMETVTLLHLGANSQQGCHGRAHAGRSKRVDNTIGRSNGNADKGLETQEVRPSDRAFHKVLRR
jgi:hypothetical protein